MGSTTTAGYADAVARGVVHLDSAVAAHLTTNFYPPLPWRLVNPLIYAIHCCTIGDPDYEPDGWVMGDGPVLPRTAEWDDDGSWYVRARDLVDACRAWEFVNVGDEQE